MDALVIIKIVNQYKTGELNYAEASLLLITIGLNSEEVIKLLNNLKPEK